MCCIKNIEKLKLNLDSYNVLLFINSENIFNLNNFIYSMLLGGSVLFQTAHQFHQISIFISISLASSYSSSVNYLERRKILRW